MRRAYYAPWEDSPDKEQHEDSPGLSSGHSCVNVIAGVGAERVTMSGGVLPTGTCSVAGQLLEHLFRPDKIITHCSRRVMTGHIAPRCL